MSNASMDKPPPNALTAGLAREWRRFDRATDAPAVAQKALLRRILAQNCQTRYGREHGFAAIRDGADFARQAPITTSETLLPMVEAMADGAADILVAGQPIFFTQTSGTTSQPKLIPLTRQGQLSAARASRRWLYRAAADHPEIMRHGVMLVTAPFVEGITPAGIAFGSASGIINRGLPPALRRRSVLPRQLVAVEDYNCRYYLMARFAVANEISLAATPNPTTLLRILSLADTHRESIIRAIHDGTPGDAEIIAGISKYMRQRLRGRLTPAPQRARQLEQIIARRGSLLPMDYWRELRLLGCWLGGTVGAQAAKLAPAFGQIPLRDLGLIASEGWFSIPVEDGTPAGPLDILGNFFEFIPVDEGSTSVLRCDELSDGKRYRMLVTNDNGLYRYDIGDVVEVRGFYRRTPKIAFVEKHGDMLNITGEKLHANHLVGAMDKTCAALDLETTAFRAVPDLEHNRYQILVCFKTNPATSVIRHKLIPMLDANLAAVNIEYAEKRRSERLLKPCLRLMSNAWESESRQASSASGRRDIQFKWQTTSAELSPIDIRHTVIVIEP